MTDQLLSKALTMNLTWRFFWNPSNAAQTISPFLYLLIPQKNSNGLVKYDFLLQKQCCLFSSIFIQVSINSVYYSFLPFCTGQKSDLLVCSFSSFSQVLFKRKEKSFLWPSISYPPFFTTTAEFISVLWKCLVQNIGCKVMLQFFDPGEEITEQFMHCHNC